MAVEHARVVGVERTEQVERLLGDIAVAAERAERADAGDRDDIGRFERLCTQLEQFALSGSEESYNVDDAAGGAGVLAAALGRDGWQDQVTPEVRDAVLAVSARGRVPVLVVDPIAPGDRQRPHQEVGPPSVADTWRSEEGNHGAAAVRERFEAQLRQAVTADSTDSASFSPSGVGHEVVTRTLHRFVQAASGNTRRAVAVWYRDGSCAPSPFPLQALVLSESAGPADLVVRFALLSIRHTEMDPIVDGAWLRNNHISQPRKQSETDEIAFDISRTQLAELTVDKRCRVLLYLYQSGFEPAVVGFYRAVVEHLLEHPGSLAVQPMFHRSAPKAGTRSRTRKKGAKAGGGGNEHAPVTTQHAPFVEGPRWAVEAS